MFGSVVDLMVSLPRLVVGIVVVIIWFALLVVVVGLACCSDTFTTEVLFLNKI